MRGFLREIRAELWKMRHTVLYPLHLGIPLLGAAVFLAYGWFAGRSGPGLLSGYVEAIGVALPFVISVVCSGNIRLEEENHFQIFLGVNKHRWKNFLTKFCVLTGMGFLSIAAAVLIFGAGLGCFVERNPAVQIPWMLYLQLTAVLFLGAVPLYLEHLFLNLKFSGMVSQCGCGAVFAVGLVSYRTGRRKMAIFSLLLECKGRSHAAAELDISGKKRRYWRKGTDANGRNLSLAHLFHLCHNWNVVSLL